MATPARPPSVALPETFCLFIGHPRTGHSIIGTVLDAHPDAVISHELNALRGVELGWSRDRMIIEIVAMAASQAQNGRIQGRHRYEVPGWWHGRYRTLQVLGDKTAYATTNMLRKDPELLQRAADLMQAELRLVHVLRNPFDCISTNLRYLHEPVTDALVRSAIEQFFREAETNARITAERASIIHVIHHEELVADAEREIAGLCDFLGLAAEDDYLSDCSAVIYDTPRASRHEVAWTSSQIAGVRELMKPFPWFRHYDFED